MDVFIKEFLLGFDDSNFPQSFLNRYELMECLSNNEYCETFLVKDWDTNEYYVAKCYNNKSTQSHSSESDLLKKLRYPGLPIYIGEYRNDEMHCIVREYIQGTSLDLLMKEHPLSQQQSLSIIRQLCEILIYLHGQNPPIIHRDIKPQNIIVDDQGKISLIDFGISRTYNEESSEDTLCFGTRHYAAPEQYGYSQTDCRSDIFSLGVLLCWLLTGSVDVQNAPKKISNIQLSGIVSKCTAFDPKDRFQSVLQVKEALSGRLLRQKIMLISFVLVFILASVFYAFNSTKLKNALMGGVTFREPLIEEAVRLSLGKDQGEILTEQDLLSINSLYVFGDKPAADADMYNTYGNHFAENDGTVLRGSITSLEDVAKLKNLRSISIAYQNIVDISPLSNLSRLEYIDFKHNPIEDVSPLSTISSLGSLGLFDTNVSDLTSLSSCARLQHLDVGYSLINSTTALDGLDSLQFVSIRRSPVQTLDHIQDHPMLEQISLSETQIIDLSPLLELPRLKVVEVDESMQNAVDAIKDQAQFEITYQ